MLKFLVCLVVITSVAKAEILGEPGLTFNQNVEYASKYTNYEPHDYQFEYGVSDPHTGDHKSQWEVKEKGVVRGGYSLLEPDGTTRVVEYIADDHGFRAVVKKLGQSIHPQVETHGFTASEVAQPPEPIPIIVEPPPKAPIFQAYDGHAENYINVQPVQPVPQIQPLIYEKPVALPQFAAYPSNNQPIAGYENHYGNQQIVYRNEEFVHKTPVLSQVYPQQPLGPYPQAPGYGFYNPEVAKGQFIGEHDVSFPQRVDVNPGEYHGVPGNYEGHSIYNHGYNQRSHEGFDDGEFAGNSPKHFTISFNHNQPPYKPSWF